MEASELMIGDWVLWKGKYVQCATISGVVYSFGRIDVTLAHCNEHKTLETHDIKSISPIPLTEEILKANGFEEVVGEKGMCGVTKAPYYKRKDSPRIYCDGNPFAVWLDEGVDIQHVHQLQHILRFCGSEKNIIL